MQETETPVALEEGALLKEERVNKDSTRVLPEKRSTAPRRLAGGLMAVTAGLAASAIFVRLRTQQAERDNPPRGKFVEVDGVRLHYVERGEGRPLLMLHGNLTMIEDLEISGIIDSAAARYRVIAFDRPGYGHSERPPGRIWNARAQAELFHRALDCMGCKRPVVFGHSLGTLAALSLALDFPSDVHGLVLAGGYYYPTPRPDLPLMVLPGVPIVGDALRYTISPLLARLMWPAALRLLFGPAPVPERFSRFPIWMALRPSQLRTIGAESAILIPDVAALRRRYSELRLPVVLLAGSEDRFVDPNTHSAALHQELPHSRLQMVPGAGHMVHHTRPDEVLGAIDRVSSD
jgi:pimeloyl-ACP methyl ester carboxylesterase